MKNISVYARRLCMLSVMSIVTATGCDGGAQNDSSGPTLSEQGAALTVIQSQMGTCLFDTGKFDDPACKFD